MLKYPLQFHGLSFRRVVKSRALTDCPTDLSFAARAATSAPSCLPRAGTSRSSNWVSSLAVSNSAAALPFQSLLLSGSLSRTAEYACDNSHFDADAAPTLLTGE